MLALRAQFFLFLITASFAQGAIAKTQDVTSMLFMRHSDTSRLESNRVSLSTRLNDRNKVRVLAPNCIKYTIRICLTEACKLNDTCPPLLMYFICEPCHCTSTHFIVSALYMCSCNGWDCHCIRDEYLMSMLYACKL